MGLADIAIGVFSVLQVAVSEVVVVGRRETLRLMGSKL